MRSIGERCKIWKSCKRYIWDIRDVRGVVRLPVVVTVLGRSVSAVAVQWVLGGEVSAPPVTSQSASSGHSYTLTPPPRPLSVKTKMAPGQLSLHSHHQTWCLQGLANRSERSVVILWHNRWSCHCTVNSLLIHSRPKWKVPAECAVLAKLIENIPTFQG